MKLYWKRGVVYELLEDNLQLSLRSVEKGFTIPGKLLRETRSGCKTVISDREFEEYFPFDENLTLDNVGEVQQFLDKTELTREESDELVEKISIMSENHARNYVKNWLRGEGSIQDVEKEVPAYLLQTLRGFAFHMLFQLCVMNKTKKK